MELKPVNQRLKFLLEKLGLSARAFSEIIGEKSSNTQNYVGTRNSMPGADYIERVLRHFETINPTWLLLGEGDPFLPGTQPIQNLSSPKSKGSINSTGGGTNTITNITLDSCKRELASAQKEIALLTSQLADKERTIQILLDKGGK